MSYEETSNDNNVGWLKRQFTKADRHGDISMRWGKLSAAIAVPLLTAAFMTSGIYKVEEGMAAVEMTGGKLTDVTGPGFHYAWPIIQSKRPYSTGNIFEVPLQNLQIYYSPDETDAITQSDVANENHPSEERGLDEKSTKEIAQDNSQQYTTHQAVVRASIDPRAIAKVHSTYGSMQSVQRLVLDAATEAYKAVVRKIDPLKINTKREVIGPETKAMVQDRLNKELDVRDENGDLIDAIRVSSITFLDFNFENGVEQAFERANSERAGVQAEQYALEKANIAVDRQAAEGRAEGAKAFAVAQEKAKAIREEGAALREYPEVLQLEGLKAWEAGGSPMPQTLILGNGSNNGGSFNPTQVAPLQVNPIQITPKAPAPGK